MTTEFEVYDKFTEDLKTKYPEMYSDVYCGISINEGWFEIVNRLSAIIHSHYKWMRETRERLLKDNPYEHEIPPECDFPTVAQIKEKFGGLRFYIDGGDEFTHGAIQMAEAWAGSTCEKCGAIGKRRDGGWIRTLCDIHEAEYQAKKTQ